jgi:hypothetical protein
VCETCTTDADCRAIAQGPNNQGLSPTQAICIQNSGPSCLCPSGAVCGNPCGVTR